MILEIFAMFVEIKKEHQLLMVGETTSFKKGKGKKSVVVLVKKPNPSPRLSASVIKGTATGAELP